MLLDSETGFCATFAPSKENDNFIHALLFREPIANFNSNTQCLTCRKIEKNRSTKMTKNPITKIIFTTSVYKRRIRKILKLLATVVVLISVLVVAFIHVHLPYVESSLPVTLQCNMELSIPYKLPNNIFQSVGGTDIHVYSAYLDRRVKWERRIRIVGIGPYNTGTVQCQIHYSDGSVISVPAEPVLLLTEDEEKRINRFYLKPYFFFCNDTLSKPIKVTQYCSQFEVLKA